MFRIAWQTQQKQSKIEKLCVAAFFLLLLILGFMNNRMFISSRKEKEINWLYNSILKTFKLSGGIHDMRYVLWIW